MAGWHDQHSLIRYNFLVDGALISNIWFSNSLQNSTLGTKCEIACKWMPQNSPMRPVDSPHKGPVTRKRFPFDDATIMLQELVLADMGLKRVDVGAFYGICEISRLNLKHNQLTLPPQLCTSKCCRHPESTLGWGKSVYDNDIRHFNVSLLRHMPQLGELHLGGIKLTHIDVFRSLYERKIHLAGNPWHCGEELSWMGEEDMAIERRLICATTTCLHGMAVAGMSKCNFLTLFVFMWFVFSTHSLKHT